MKLNVLTVALATTLFGTLAASAQTVIEERHDPPGVTVEHDRPDSSVTVEKRGGFLGTEHKTITRETTGSGDCSSKTVHKEGIGGETTVKKTNCD
jgi:hypothetical protein